MAVLMRGDIINYNKITDEEEVYINCVSFLYNKLLSPSLLLF